MKEREKENGENTERKERNRMKTRGEEMRSEERW